MEIKTKAAPVDEIVFVLFELEATNRAFSELLNSMGKQTCIITDVSSVTEGSRLITEQKYIPLLTDQHKEKCLIVGNSESKINDSPLFLSRPFTAQKIESAFQRFLTL